MQLLASTNRISHSLTFSLAAGLLSLPALAGTPGALDHVPSDAQAVVVVPHFGGLLNDINAANTMLGDQGEPMVMMITSMVRGMPGINLDGSIAGVLTFDEDMEGEPEMVAILPVSDFKAFSEGHSFEDGLYGMDMGGEMLYFRQAGDGHIVMGDDSGLVHDFDAKGGNLAAHTKRLGGTGAQVAGGNDMFAYVNFSAFQDQIDMAMEEMESQAEMVEMMGGAEAVAGFDMMLHVFQTIANDGSSMAFGMSFDPEAGISYDMGVQFKEGSTSASYLQNAGNAGKYFDRVPSMDYFFASAFDMSGSGIQKLATDYIDMLEEVDTTGMLDGKMDMLMGEVQGGIQVMGASDNVMGGLFTNMIQYMEVKDADAYLEASRAMYAGMNEQLGELAELGMKFDAAIDSEPTQINGVDAYGYKFAMDMSEMEDIDMGMAMGGMNPAMIMGMLFGADSGPSGYMAKVGNGIVSTMTKDAEFFTKASNAAAGKNTMKGDKSIAKTAAMLPKNSIMQTYIAADHLMNTAGPMMMMFGVIPEFEPVEALAPIGLGMSANGGGVLFRAALPMETIQAAMEMVPAEMFEDNDEDMDF